MSESHKTTSDNKTLIITGASRGLGAAAARCALELGANVVLSARSAGGLRATAAQAGAEGERTLVVPGDVSRAEDCQELVQKAVARFGRLDAIVNNAGVIAPIAPLAAAEPEAWQRNIAVNLVGPFYLMHFALPQLRPRRGRVVNVSSGAAVRPTPGWSAYCAAKAALNHLTAVLAEEEPDVVALALRPGVVDTEMQETIREEGRSGMPRERHQRFVRYHETGQLLPPELPGRALATLALFAPHAWSGAFLQWDEARVQALVEAHDG